MGGDGNENSKKKKTNKQTIGLRSKKNNNNFACVAHFFCVFLCRCFVRRQRETSRNFLVTLSLLSTPMKTLKLSRKKELASLLLFFISKSPGDYAIYCRNARVLEMQNFTPAYMKGWTYVRTIFSEPKFLGCIDYQIFLPMRYSAASASGARAPL